MSDSKKYIEFLPKPKPTGMPHTAELKNPRPPIDIDRTNDTIPEQIPCSQKVGIRRKYDAIHEDVDNCVSGEVIMRKYGFKRTKDLLEFLDIASTALGKPQITINFETNFEKGEKPLHPLKIARDGSLRISAKQIMRRAKIVAPEGTEFIIKPLDAGDSGEGFKLIVIKK